MPEISVSVNYEKAWNE